MASNQPSKITLTNGAIDAALGAVTTIAQAASNGKLKLRLARMAAVLRHEAELYAKTLTDLQKEYLELDERGNPRPMTLGGKEIPGTVAWKDKAAYDARAKDLKDDDIEIVILTIDEAEIEALPSFEGNIEGILPLITPPTAVA